MCGFIGTYGFIPNEKLKRLSLESLKFRGPDKENSYINDNLWIGFKRLAINDLSDKGLQPFVSEDDNTIIVFNGEIYNYISLKNELIQDGIKLKSSCDGEILISLFNKYQKKFFEKIYGMYSIVVYDKKNQEVVLARDHVGMKPLYFYYQNKKLIFSSNLEAIKIVLKEFNYHLEIDGNSLACSLSLGYVPAPQTIYKSISSVEPSKFVVIKQNNLSSFKHWNPSLNDEIEFNYEEFEYLLTKIVKEHTLSDVPVSLLLSSGADSTSLGYFLNKLNTHTTAINLDFENKIGFSEKEQAEKISNFFGFDFNYFTIKQDDVFKNCEDAHSKSYNPNLYSALVTYFKLSESVSKNYKVCLGGDGGDELFGGYNWYESSPNFKQKLKELLLNKKYGEYKRFSKKSFFHNHAAKVFPRFLPYEINKLLNIDINFDDEAMISRLQNNFINGVDETKATRYMDLITFTSNSICQKIDNMSMNFSLEVRCPFLDRRLIEYVFKLKNFNYNCSEKFILKKILKNNLSDELRSNKKFGFSMKGLDKVENSKIIDKIKSLYFYNDYIDHNYFNKLISQKRGFFKEKLWAILFLSYWYEENK